MITKICPKHPSCRNKSMQAGLKQNGSTEITYAPNSLHNNSLNTNNYSYSMVSFCAKRQPATLTAIVKRLVSSDSGTVLNLPNATDKSGKLTSMKLQFLQVTASDNSDIYHFFIFQHSGAKSPNKGVCSSRFDPSSSLKTLVKQVRDLIADVAKDY